MDGTKDVKLEVECRVCGNHIAIKVADDESSSRLLTTLNTKTKFILKVEPDTEKAVADAENAVWTLTDPSVGIFDAKTKEFESKKVGNAKLCVKLAKTMAEFPIIVRPAVENFVLSVINRTDSHIQEVKDDANGSVEYIRVQIATMVRVKLARKPDNAIIKRMVIECSDGVQIVRNPEEDGFVIKAGMIGKNRIVKIGLAGSNIIKTLHIDVVSVNTDNYDAATIVGCLIAAAFSVYGAFNAHNWSPNLILIVIPSLVLAGYSLYAASKYAKFVVGFLSAVMLGGYIWWGCAITHKAEELLPTKNPSSRTYPSYETYRTRSVNTPINTNKGAVNTDDKNAKGAASSEMSDAVAAPIWKQYILDDDVRKWIKAHDRGLNYSYQIAEAEVKRADDSLDQAKAIDELRRTYKAIMAKYEGRLKDKKDDVTMKAELPTEVLEWFELYNTPMLSIYKKAKSKVRRLKAQSAAGERISDEELRDAIKDFNAVHQKAQDVKAPL